MSNFQKHRRLIRNQIEYTVTDHTIEARPAEALDQAVTEALKTITADNAAAWFKHCGCIVTAI